MITDEVRQFRLADALEQHDSSFIIGGTIHAGQVALYVEPANIVSACRFLKEAHQCRLSGITAVDWHPLEPRFEVVYLVHSMARRNERVRLKCKLDGEAPEIDSVTSVWPGANWYERETFDLFGIRFRNHPDLKRIMMPDGWEGHPLRKDFPIHGYRYSYADESNVI